VYYFIRDELLTGNNLLDDRLAKNIELLVRIFLNHYHPYMTTLTGGTVQPQHASLLLLVSALNFC
jgi:hypothetical protein